MICSNQESVFPWSSQIPILRKREELNVQLKQFLHFALFTLNFEFPNDRFLKIYVYIVCNIISSFSSTLGIYITVLPS